jgi:hypothetical protein
MKFGFDLIYRQVNYFRPEAGKGFFNLFGNGIGSGSTGWESADLLAGFVNDYQIGAQSGYQATINQPFVFHADTLWELPSLSDK